MFRINLLVIGIVFADSGDTGPVDSDTCARYSIRLPFASFEADVCHTDSIARMCEYWMPLGCPPWEVIREWDGYDTYKCGPGMVTHAAYSNYSEGGYTAYFFDEVGSVIGVKDRTTSTTYCCEGQSAHIYTQGVVGCPNSKPVEFEDSGSEEPSSDCGCGENGGGAAAGLGLLLLARRWFKR